MRSRHLLSFGLLLGLAGGIAGVAWWRTHAIGDVAAGGAAGRRQRLPRLSRPGGPARRPRRRARDRNGTLVRPRRRDGVREERRRDPGVDPRRPAAAAPRREVRRAAAGPAHAGVAGPLQRARGGRARRLRPGGLRLRPAAGGRRGRPRRGGPPRLLRLPRPAGPRRHAEPAVAEGLHPVVERDGLPRARARRRRDPRVGPRRRPATAARAPGRFVLHPAPGDPDAGLRRPRDGRRARADRRLHPVAAVVARRVERPARAQPPRAEASSPRAGRGRGPRSPSRAQGDGRTVRTSNTTPVEEPVVGRMPTRTCDRPRVRSSGSAYSTGSTSPGRSSKSCCDAIGRPSTSTSKRCRRESPPQ